MSIDRNKYLGEVLHTHKLRHIGNYSAKGHGEVSSLK